jgi:hypothetical protein
MQTCNIFDVVVNEDVYTIHALEDETFNVYLNDKKLGNIFPEIGIDTDLTWNTSELIPLEDVAAIGLAIERKEL